MPFDISTARPIEETQPKKSGGFDISTARPYEEIKKQPLQRGVIEQGLSSMFPFTQLAQSRATTQKQPERFMQEIDPFTRQPLKILQEKGEQVQKESSEILGKATGFPKISEFITKSIELTPQNLSQALGFEISPLVLSRVLGRFPKSIANRMFGRNAPKDIGMGRLAKGEPPVGTQVLTDPKLEALRINDKNEIYNRASAGIQDLGTKIKSEFKKILGFTKKTPTSMTPFSQEIPPMGIKTFDIARSAKKSFDSLAHSFGKNSPEYKRGMNFIDNFLREKPDFLDINMQNDLREYLGNTIGKRFNANSELTGVDLPEIVDAQKAMWSTLRNSLGRHSPKLDDLLKDQHVLFEISRSVAPEAARGYGAVPLGVSHAVTLPMSTNMRLANFLENLIPGVSGKGVAAGFGAAGGATGRTFQDEVTR